MGTVYSLVTAAMPHIYRLAAANQFHQAALEHMAARARGI